MLEVRILVNGLETHRLAAVRQRPVGHLEVGKGGWARYEGKVGAWQEDARAVESAGGPVIVDGFCRARGVLDLVRQLLEKVIEARPIDHCPECGGYHREAL